MQSRDAHRCTVQISAISLQYAQGRYRVVTGAHAQAPFHGEVAGEEVAAGEVAGEEAAGEVGPAAATTRRLPALTDLFEPAEL